MQYEITNFRDFELANGDPIVVYNGRTGEATCLGTGFTSMEDVRYKIEMKFDVQPEDRFDVFGIDGVIEFKESDEKLITDTTE